MVNIYTPQVEYIQQATIYISKQYNIPIEEAYNKVINVLNTSNLKDPIVKHKRKLDNGDMEIQELPLSNYINSITSANDILVPSFTSYYHPDKMKSIHSIFMDYNTKERSKFKKKAFKLKQENDINGYLFNNVMQKRKKISNNSLSGAYSSKSTILRNPSAHYTLTSITRCVSSIGNAYTESLVAGNKHFRNYDITLNYITTIITNIDKKMVKLCIDKFNLHIPSPDEILSMILSSSKWYWYDEKLHFKIYNFLTKLNDVEKVSIMYTNDLWHLRMYNETLIKTMIDEIIVKLNTGITDTSIVNSIPQNLEILTKLICSNDIKGMNINYEEIKNTELGMTLLSTMTNVYQMFNKYSFLFKTFLYTEIMPPGISYVKTMFRKCIVLSDTDSTCGSYDIWTNWYNDNTKQIPVMGVIMTLVGNVIDNSLKTLSKNMNVPKEHQNVLKMKNEFYWPVFINTMVNKHYMSLIDIQEGNVYKEPDLEVKGVHLIASAADQQVAKQTKNIMLDILYKIRDNQQVSIMDVINKIANLEREIIKRIKDGDITVFKKDTIKDSKAYKLEPHLSPYIYHIMWKDVFSSKYGETEPPSYMVVKIPTTLDSKRKTLEWLETIQDEDIKDRLINFITKYKKDNIGTFRVPYIIASGKGIPIEILNCVDEKRIVQDNLLSGYMILESLGIHKKKDALLIDMGY